MNVTRTPVPPLSPLPNRGGVGGGAGTSPHSLALRPVYRHVPLEEGGNAHPVGGCFTAHLAIGFDYTCLIAVTVDCGPTVYVEDGPVGPVSGGSGYQSSSKICQRMDTVEK